MSRGLIDRVLAAVTDKLTSTDWAWLINQPNTNIRYRKKNGFVIVNGSSTVYNIPTGGVYIATLPDGFRPDITLDNPASALGGTSEMLVRILADGRILLLGNPATTYWSFTFTFPISGGVVTYLLTRLTRLAERRWRHESGVNRQDAYEVSGQGGLDQDNGGARGFHNGQLREHRLYDYHNAQNNNAEHARRRNGYLREQRQHRHIRRYGQRLAVQAHAVTPERGCAA